MKNSAKEQRENNFEYVEMDEKQHFEDPHLIKSKRRGAFPTMADLLAMLGIFFIAQIVVGVVSVFMGGTPQIADGATSFEAAQHQGVQMLIIYLASMLLSIGVILVYRHSRGGKGRFLYFTLKSFDTPLLLGGVVMLVSAGVVIEPLLAIMPKAPDVLGRGWGMLLSVVVMAPILEEILCRGLIFESLREKRGVFTAWIFSSLFFAIMHFHPAMVLNAFVMGLILCFVYIKTRSLVASMILHAFNNSIAYIFIVLGMEGVMLRDLIGSDILYKVVYCLAALIFIISAVIVGRVIKRLEAKSELSTTQNEEAEAEYSSQL